MAVTREKLAWVGLSVPGAYPGAVPTFEPPTVTRSGYSGHPLFRRMKFQVGTTVLKQGGAYLVIQNPRDEDLVAADEVYRGGSAAPLKSVEEVAALEAAGYIVQGPT